MLAIPARKCLKDRQLNGSGLKLGFWLSVISQFFTVKWESDKLGKGTMSLYADWVFGGLGKSCCEGYCEITVKICEWDSRLLGGKCTAL